MSKAYGVLAASGAAVLGAPENEVNEDATTSGFLASCDALEGADYYQWYLDGVPYATSVAPLQQYSGLTPGSTVTWQVAAGNAAGVGVSLRAVVFLGQRDERRGVFTALVGGRG